MTRTLDHASAPSEDNASTKKVLARGEAVEDAAAARSVTALSWIAHEKEGSSTEGGEGKLTNSFGIVAAFSDGTVTSWRYSTNCWREHVLVGHDPRSVFDTARCEHYYEDGMEKSNLQESIADISTCNLYHDCGSAWLVATASSKGIFLHISNVGKEEEEIVYTRQVGHHAAASVNLQCQTSIGQNDDEERKRECYLFAGSASPRHNKVWVYTIPYCSIADMGNRASAWVSLPLLAIEEPTYHGHLMGHQDWITCFSWLDQFTPFDNTTERKESLLASSGHDAKIRLWKFSTYPSIRDGDDGNLELKGDDSDGLENSDDDEANIDDLEEEEGEARLIVNHATATTTAVSLEALLLGHEEPVTSLTWRHQTKKSDKPCLLSSSMDRTILLWMEEADDSPGATGAGVWVPISRVGSAGGILGGPIGASLMGFVDATFSPVDASRIVGHGYGGSIHFWTQEVPSEEIVDGESDDYVAPDEEDEAIVTARWVADPGITGHLRSVVDMEWDPNDGEYLLTVSMDQTTRLWAEVPITSAKNNSKCRWVEVGRPQVHGYDMTSIVCIGGNDEDNSDPAAGSGEPCHRFVSGADEKVLRVFDAPASTLRMLRSIKQARAVTEDYIMEKNEQQPSWRVERAFLPSLGLSNKATADVDQESSKFAGPTSNNDDEFSQTLDSVKGSNSVELKLPSERDLGVTTLWPETRTLFGHESELVCLDAYRAPLGENQSTLVASSCKARNDVASAAIRLWDCKEGKCVGILKGGHRSTVSTMSFSRDGKYLASSGKDRRICIWKRVIGSDDGASYELSAAADSAHKRIVWSVHFCPKIPDVLASGSRDGFIKVWRVVEAADGCLDLKELLRFEPVSKAAGKNPITTVAFANNILQGSNGQTRYGILSIGTDSGGIEVWAVPVSSDPVPPEMKVKSSPLLLCVIPSNDSHFDTVKKLSWRPNTNHTEEVDEGMVHLTLASCGQDNGVRIFNLKVRSP